MPPFSESELVSQSNSESSMSTKKKKKRLRKKSGGGRSIRLKKPKQNNKSLPPGNNAGRQISTQIQTKHLPSVRLSIPAFVDFYLEGVCDKQCS